MSTRPGLLGPALIHVLALLLVATLLLLRAQPVNWDTPTNLAYQEGWASLVTVIVTFAVLGGSVEGVLWARGARVGAVVACLVSAAFAFAGAGFYLDGPIANGGQVATAGREQVVMSQLVWAAFWVVQTLLMAVWLRLLGRRPRRTRAAPTSVGAAHVPEG